MGSLTTTDGPPRCECCNPALEGFIRPHSGAWWTRDWISQHEFDHYVHEFTRNGLYRAAELVPAASDRSWELTATTPARDDRCPIAVCRRRPPTRRLAYTPRDRVRDVVSGDYREVMIEGAGPLASAGTARRGEHDTARLPVQIGVLDATSNELRGVHHAVPPGRGQSPTPSHWNTTSTGRWHAGPADSGTTSVVRGTPLGRIRADQRALRCSSPPGGRANKAHPAGHRRGVRCRITIR